MLNSSTPIVHVMPKPKSGMVVISGTNGKGKEVYENSQGGLLTDTVIRFADCPKDQEFVMRTMTQAISMTAAKGGKEQTPELKKYFNVPDVNFDMLFWNAKRVLYVAPTYSPGLELKGSKNDAGDLVKRASEIFQKGCQILILADLPARVHHLASAQTKVRITIRSPNQRDVQEAVRDHLGCNDNVVIFVSAHGVRSRGDEKIYFEKSASCYEIWGQDVFRYYLKSNPNAARTVVLVVDMCNCYGFPDDGDLQAVMQEMTPEARLRWGLPVEASDEGWDISPAPDDEDLDISPAPANEGLEITPAPANEGLEISPAPANEGLEISPAPANEDLEISPAPANEGLETPPAPAEDVTPPVLNGRGIVSDVGGSLLQAVQWTGRTWDTLEATGQMVFGAGLSAMLGLVLTAMVLASGVGALYLGLQHAVRHEARRISVTSVVVMAVLSGLPYLFDPVVLQKLLQKGVSPEGSVYLGFAGAALSFLVTLVYILSDFKRLKQRAGVLPKASLFLAKTSGLAGLLLQIHFMDGGAGVQQTVHVRANGVDSFVMYHPLRGNATHTYCGVPVKGDNVVLLPLETGYSLFDKELTDGSRGDVTCLYDVFCKRVAERAEGDAGNIKALSYNYGAAVFDLKEVHQEVASLRRMFKVDNSTWAQDPVLSRVGLAHKLEAAWKQRGFRLELEAPSMASAEPLTWLERVASPFIVGLGALLGSPAWPERLLKHAIADEL